MTPEQRAHDPRAETALIKLLNPEPLYEVCPQCAVTSADVLDALAAAGLRVVAEGHAVIDGVVVELCARCGHDEWWHSITGDGYCVDACGCRGFVPRGGAPDTEGRREADGKEAEG